MNRKKIFSRSVAALLTMIFAFTMGFLPVSASASNLNTNNGFYLATEEVPDGVLTYAQNNIYKFLLARSEEENVNFSSITMGSPFTFGSNTYESTDVFFFPVFSDGQIIYTFRVYMDETGYTGILSRYMAKELNNYRYSTSQSEPLYIYMEAGNVLARLKDNVTLLEKRHPGYEPSASVANATPITDNKVVTDISTPIMFAESPLTRASASKTLTLDMKETQSDQQWCAAFVMSSILRYKGAGSSITVETIMKHFYPNSSNLKNESVSRSQLVSYAKDKGFSKTTESSSTLSNSTVVSEINNDSPFYAGCAGSGSYKKARHALAICGYNNNASTYTVWNPWYSETETISQSSKTYVINSESSFKWDCTIYKVRK